MAIPTRDECYRVLQDVGVGEEVMRHVELVESIASAFAAAINARSPGLVDTGLVTAGALLHDIGRTRTHTIEHARFGVEMAEALGLDPRIVEIIRRHVGGGLSPGEAKALGLPAWDGMPRTVEEKIVCHADTLVGAGGRRTLARTIERIGRKNAPEYERRVAALHRELADLADEDLDAIGPSPTNL